VHANTHQLEKGTYSMASLPYLAVHKSRFGYRDRDKLDHGVNGHDNPLVVIMGLPDWAFGVWRGSIVAHACLGSAIKSHAARFPPSDVLSEPLASTLL